MNDETAGTTTGGDAAEESYFTAKRRESLEYWRNVVATMPPMTQDEINRIAAILARIDARRRKA